MAGASILQLSVSPDGRLLAVSAQDATATVWEIRSRTRVGNAFPVGHGLIPQVAFEPSGRLLITELGSTLEWPLDRRHACAIRRPWVTRPARPASRRPSLGNASAWR